MSLRSIFALATKEALQLVRDRTTLGMLIGVPILQVLLFGFAIELKPHTFPLSLVASSSATATRITRWINADFPGSVVKREIDASSALKRLVRGETLVIIDMDSTPPQVKIDGTDPVLASEALTHIEQFIHNLASPDLEQNEASRVQVTTLFNPKLRTQPYLVSGLLGLILTMTMVMMSALCIARERERGTLEGLQALHIRTLELAIGKLLPYLVLGIVQAAAILALSYIIFKVTIQGSWLLLAVATLLFIVANLALGFFFSTVARSQTPAMQMTFFFFLPSSLLSGFMFPFSAMPQWAKNLGELLPLTHFLRIVRGVVLRGAMLEDLAVEILPILGFGAAAILMTILARRE